MSLVFYMDENAPSAITEGLRHRGIGVLTAQEDGQSGAVDTVILQRASELQRVLFTRDRNFLAAAARCLAASIEFFDVVYIHPEKTNAGACIDDLQLIAEVCSVDDVINQVYRLPV